MAHPPSICQPCNFAPLACAGWDRAAANAAFPDLYPRVSTATNSLDLATMPNANLRALQRHN